MRIPPAERAAEHFLRGMAVTRGMVRGRSADTAASPTPRSRAGRRTRGFFGNVLRRRVVRDGRGDGAGRGSPQRADASGPRGDGSGAGDGRGPVVEAATTTSASSSIDVIVKQGGEWQLLLRRLAGIAAPYFSTPPPEQGARASDERGRPWLRAASVLLLSLAGTGVSVGFNFLSRDFFNALTEKDSAAFMQKLALFPVAYAVGIPVFVFRDFAAATFSLRWRRWMTSAFLDQYLSSRSKAFYSLQGIGGTAVGVVDNPDQRVNEDIKAFTADAVQFVLVIFGAGIDLISFSGILYGIYPPLFIALILYSLGGTAISIVLGRPLVGLNFAQEKKEADFRYALVRVRENAESIAFYGGEESELKVLKDRFSTTLDNLTELLVTSRNLQFFTSFYRLLIQILPAAVVAPLYFKGDIEFGVVNQASQAFNHILSDFSLVVYQIEGIAGFSAVIQRLGQFEDTIKETAQANDATAGIAVEDVGAGEPQAEGGATNRPLLSVEGLRLETPGTHRVLVSGLDLTLMPRESVLVTGASGSGKTSLLRALAGLWRTGAGRVVRRKVNVDRKYDIFFLPQRPYMVLGSLRSQLLYPIWTENGNAPSGEHESSPPRASDCPADDAIVTTLVRVGLGGLLDENGGGSTALDTIEDWAPKLSLGEQQRLAFARLLLARPSLAVLDESTSALDETREAQLYGELKTEGIAYISVGHRSTLEEFHDKKITLHGEGGAFSVVS